MTWWKIEIEVPSALAEPLSYLLAEATGHIVETRDATTLSRPTDGLEDTSHLVIGLSEAPDDALQQSILDVLEPFDLGAKAVKTQSSDDETWRDGWKAFLKGGQMSRRVWVRPPWEAPEPSAEATIIIDPGMAFGTGQHETTRGVMRALDDVLAAKPGVRVLDVGCGSAILAIGAALLGSDAVAFDNDPDTLENARDNVRLNACEGRVSVHIGTIEAIGQSYPVVVANILARVLIELATPLAARAADTLILAGLLHADADAVASAFPDFECRSTLKEGDWSILHLSRVRGAALP